MDCEIGLRKTWNILRCLIDPENSKTTQRNNISILLHKFQGTNTELLKAIQDRYIGDCTREGLPLHMDNDNAHLD